MTTVPLDLWTRCQSVVPNDVPRDFSPRVAFVSRVSDTVLSGKDGGGEMSAPRPYVTDPFHSSSSAILQSISIYRGGGLSVSYSILDVQVCLGMMHFCQLRMCPSGDTYPKAQNNY